MNIKLIDALSSYICNMEKIEFFFCFFKLCSIPLRLKANIFVYIQKQTQSSSKKFPSARGIKFGSWWIYANTWNFYKFNYFPSKPEGACNRHCIYYKTFINFLFLVLVNLHHRSDGNFYHTSWLLTTFIKNMYIFSRSSY